MKDTLYQVFALIILFLRMNSYINSKNLSLDFLITLVQLSVKFYLKDKILRTNQT